MKWVLKTHFAEVAAIIGGGQYSQLDRAEAHLDGLRLGQDNSLELVRETLQSSCDDCDDLVPATILAVELGGRNDIDLAIQLLSHEDLDVRNSCRIALRFANISRCLPQLKSATQSNDAHTFASAIDVLAFHRQPVTIDIQRSLNRKDVDLQYLAFESSGRSPGRRSDNDIIKGLELNSPRIRNAVLRAGCRNHINRIREICHTRAIQNQCRESIHFFGLLSESHDDETLIKLLHNSDTTIPALTAIGKSGWAHLVPSIFDFLDSDDYTEHASLAFERITGLTVPRGEPREPPEDLDEDEKDFWVTVGMPETKIIRDWWQDNSNLFEQNQRYQEGHCVSQNPLPIIVNNLSQPVALDAYLRERALNHHTTPDWELETWPKYWQHPAWAFSQ